MSSPSQTNPPLQPNDPFFGLEGTLAKDIKQTTRIKAAILGAPKSGKSWFAATAPGNKRIYDFDSRLESLAGKPNILGTTLQDDNPKSPSVVPFLEAELSALQYKKIKNQPIPDTYIFDSITFLLASIKNAYMRDNPKDGRSIKVAGQLLQVGMSYDWINVANRFMEYMLTEYSKLGHVIFVFHERDEKDYAESKPNDTRYTGKVTVNPQFISPILSLFNEVFRIEVKQGKFTVTCKQNDEVNASTTLLVDATEPPNFEDMLKKHQANLLKNVIP